jgi:uncharacterized protein
MSLGRFLRRHWFEALLVMAIALPWLALLVLGIVWLWQSRLVWGWAIAAAVLSAAAWSGHWLVRRRVGKAEERSGAPDSLHASTQPSPDWRSREREAWAKVVGIAQEVPPFSLIEFEEPVAAARRVIDAVARHFHPEHTEAWAQFTLPEAMLLTEQVSRDLRGALLTIPFARQVTLGHGLLVWRYGAQTWTAWQAAYPFWRVARVLFNPLTALSQEARDWLTDKAFVGFIDRMRARVTQEFVLSVGRAAIDLYSKRLTLSLDELTAAATADSASDETPLAPVRIVLAGQVNAGKSSLVNALAQEVRCAVGPLPTTSRSTEYRIELHGLPAVAMVDTPGLGDNSAPEPRVQAERADLVLWVASATQPARGADRTALDDFRTWERAQLARRPPHVVLALTHIDELRPASEWTPPYDLTAPEGPKARNILAAIQSVASALDVPASAIVPIAMPPGRQPYNVDALWARIALELDGAKLVQLDRLRISGQPMSLRELASQLGHAGRFIIEGIAKS